MNGCDDISVQAHFDNYNLNDAFWTDTTRERRSLGPLFYPTLTRVMEKAVHTHVQGKIFSTAGFTHASHEPEVPRLIRQGRPTLLRERTSRPMERGDHFRGDATFCWNPITVSAAQARQLTAARIDPTVAVVQHNAIIRDDRSRVPDTKELHQCHHDHSATQYYCPRTPPRSVPMADDFRSFKSRAVYQASQVKGVLFNPLFPTNPRPSPFRSLSKPSFFTHSGFYHSLSMV